MTALTAGQGQDGSAMSAVRRAAAWWSSETVRHALRVALAMVIAFYVSLSLGWERPAWAGLAVALCSLSTTGESVNKGLLRILGTFLAGSVALLLNALFPQDRWAYLLSATTYIGFCAYMMGHSTRWYFWFIGGYVMALLALAGGPEGAASFEIVVLRLQQTTLGVITYTVVAMLLWPQRRSPILRQSAGSLMDMQRRLLGHGFAVLRGDPEDPGATRLRVQASAGAAGLPEIIDGAELDSLDVWDARRSWRRFAGDAAALNEVLERWRHGFGELEKLDLGRLMPDLQAFATELDGRLASVTRMLADEAPLKEPEGRAPVLAGDALDALTPFDRAAADRGQDLLQRIDRLTRSLFAIAAEIRGVPSSAPPEHTDRDAALPWTLDPDRLACALRAFVTVWLILLACMYVPDLPMPPGVIPVAAAVGIQLAVMPQISVRTLIGPLVLGAAVGGAFYLLVMPHLSSFAGLGAGIFIAVFLVSVLPSKPQQALSRTITLSFFPMLISVSNSQSYSLLFPFNFALMTQLAMLAVWIATWFPVSFIPDRVVSKQLRRFFASARRLARTGSGAGATGMRQALDLREVTGLPEKIRRWFAALPAAAYGDGSPSRGQDLADGMQMLGDRLRELAALRGAPQSELLVRELAPDMRSWRNGIQEVLRGLDADPQHIDAPEWRARLDAKLATLEARIESVLSDAPAGAVSAEEFANMYRLLGAYRGVSESLVRLTEYAAAMDWERLREARF
ncbi:MAG: FUSC family protein [Gammaproteobacteria bacterium]|jgi:hypothetical protein